MRRRKIHSAHDAQTAGRSKSLSAQGAQTIKHTGCLLHKTRRGKILKHTVCVVLQKDKKHGDHPVE